MPTYKFFEPKHEHHEPTKFAEFELSASQPKKRSIVKEERQEFKATKMPDFEYVPGKPENKETPKLTRPVEFHFLTDARCADKQVKQPEEPVPVFKATPIRCNLQEHQPAIIKSEKKPTVPVAMSLASQERSLKRELFDLVKKER